MEKKHDRRRFLKNGALLAGVAVGAVRTAGGEALDAESTDIRPKDLHAYGERSRFETSIRTGSLGTWPQPTSPPDYHKDFGFRTPLQDSVGFHHATGLCITSSRTAMNLRTSIRRSTIC